MNERSAAILYHTIETYIATGQPVGSAQLRRQAGLPVSAATIRTALHDLDDAGYLRQPHTSAGRVPTDRGYRFYVDYWVPAALASAQRRQLRALYQTAVRRHQHAAAAIASAAAALSHAYAIAGQTPRGMLYHTGMSYVVSHKTPEDLAALQEMSVVIDQAEELIRQLAARTTGETHVYIGQENPFAPAAHTSLLARVIRSVGHTTVITIIGPKRMPYHQHISMLNELTHLV